MLVKDVQSLASRAHMRHSLWTLQDAWSDHQCHRCMRRFADHAQFNKHIDEAGGLKPAALLEPPVKKSVPPPLNEEKPPRSGFKSLKAKLMIPPRVYMDYGIVWTRLNPPEHAQSGQYTVEVETNGRVASHAYTAPAFEGVDGPEEHRLELYRVADAGIHSLLSLSKLGIQQSGHVSRCAPQDESR